MDKKSLFLVLSSFVATILSNVLTHYHTMPHFQALKIHSCGKHCEKRRNCLLQAFVLFSQCFLPYIAIIFHFKCTLKCRLQFVSICTSQKFCSLVTTPCFYVFYRCFEHTVGKGEIAHNEQFLLFPKCFLLFGELSAIFIKFEFVVCKSFQFGRVYYLSFGKGLT